MPVLQHTDRALMMDKDDEIEDMYKGFAEQIKAARKAKKLRQSDIDQQAGLTQHHTSKIERGQNHPSAATLFKIGKVLNINFNIVAYDETTDTEVNPAILADNNNHPAPDT